MPSVRVDELWVPGWYPRSASNLRRGPRISGTGQRLAALRHASSGAQNLVPAILDCARASCTLYEIRHAMEEVFGSYKEPVFF